MRSEPPCVGSSSTSNSVRPCGGEDRLGGDEREVREVLVVDRVELVLVASAAAGAETRSSPTPPGLSSMRMPATKSFRSGTWASTLLPTSRSAAPAFGDELAGELAAEELDERRHAPLLGARATLAAGSMPSAGMPRATKCCSR